MKNKYIPELRVRRDPTRSALGIKPGSVSRISSDFQSLPVFQTLQPLPPHPLTTMPSFRAISLFFVASLASLSFTSAAPQYTSNQDVHHEGAPSGCDAVCMAQSNPVPVIIADLQTKVNDKLAEIRESASFFILSLFIVH